MKPANSQLTRLTRRDWLDTSARALGGIALSGAAGAGLLLADDRAGTAIDSHVHVWTPDTRRYPLAKGFSPAQMQPKSFTPEELLAHARPAGVGRIVLIQMNFYGFDNSYMLDTMRGAPGVFSGVAVIDEQAAGVRGTMRELKQQGVRGFRLYPNERPVEPFLAGEGIATMWKTGADEQLAMCMLINPAAIPLVDKMCQKYPETPVVVDHFGRIGVDGTIRAADLDNLCRLARHQHAHVKISAFYALGKKQAPYTDLAPMIRRLVEAYSPKRLMWATDCPFQVQHGHTYRDSIELVRSRLDFLTPDDREWLLSKTAERVYLG